LGLASAGAGTLLLTLGAALPASAVTTGIDEGHVDIVSVECSAPDFEVEYSVTAYLEDGDQHLTSGTGAGQIGSVSFDYGETADSPYVNYASGEWTVGSDPLAEDVIPHLGFAYHWDIEDDPFERCPEYVDITWSDADNRVVEFEGDTSFRVYRGDHEHGQWTYEADEAGAYEEYALTFNTTSSEGNDQITPVNVTFTP
jgi:hypothetical protein